ncbi:unnamed protein product [Vitrella brassicaformis CCMP3155]|uniref:IPT/TIG domain-containing protein n=2 Tax=Vitrella brassicaformis TaxID=1169539 RepID=A0A0G4H362_VITBC|nr:unnamed protein product [Vitrella brassicaformis CCMP3155]|eukprot:CEM37878.1 unnamed protein product [Vitrella brassicaformis CCMP3155]
MEPLAHTGRENFIYSIPVESPVTVVVNLYFAEVLHKGKPGRRVQNVFVENNQVLSDFDTYAIAAVLVAPEGPKEVRFISKDTRAQDVVGNSTVTVYNGPNEPFGTIVKVETPMAVIEDNTIDIRGEAVKSKSWLTAIEVYATEVVLDITVTADSPTQTEPFTAIAFAPETPTQTLTIENRDSRDVKLPISFEGGNDAQFTVDPAEVTLKAGETSTVEVTWTGADTADGPVVTSLKLSKHLRVLISADVTNKEAMLDVQSGIQMGLITPLSYGGSGKGIQAPLSSRQQATITRVVAFGSDDGIQPLEITSKATVPMRIGFAAENAGDFGLIVAFMGPDFETRFMTVTGRGVNKGEPHYLHPVLDLPPGGYVVDYDGDGKESLLLMGHFSHTHEPKMSVEKWTYSVNGQVVSSGVDKDITDEYDTGVYTVQLTIEDGEAKTLADTGSVAVVPIDKVPGCAALLYKPPASQLDEFFEAPMDGINLRSGSTVLEPKWIGSSLEKGCEFKPDGRNNNIMGSPFKQDVILRAKGTLKVNDGMKNNKGEVPITISADPAVQMMLRVNGEPFSLSKGNAKAKLPNGSHDFEISWLITNPASLPLSLHTNGGVTEIDDVSHSQQDYPPFINRISPTRGHVSGGQKITIEGAGFMNPHAVKKGVSLIFGNTHVDYLTDSQVLKADGTEIVYEVSPGAEEELSVSVRTPHGVSKKKRFEYSSRVAPAIKWTSRTVLLAFDSEAPLKRKRRGEWNGSLTQGEWGPDRRLYMSDIGGGIRALEWTSNNDIDGESLIEITTIMKEYPGHVIIGFGFDPFGDPDDPEIYVAHSPMFQWGGDCFSQENNTAKFLGVLSKLKGPPLFKHHEVVVDGLPVSNHDHGLNGISFDNSGSLYLPIGGMTNIGWPACILGGLPESHYSGALIKVELRNPKRSRTLEWVDYFTRDRIGNPNQLVADTYDVAPWVTGVYPYSFGIRNAYDTVYTTKGQLWTSSNGWNEGYGLAINGPRSRAVRSTAGISRASPVRTEA